MQIKIQSEPLVFPYRWPQAGQVPGGRMPMIWVVDRFDGEFAVCENSRRQMKDIRRAELPAGVQPGDVLRHTRAGYLIDTTETAKRKQSIDELTKDLWG